MSDFVSSIPSGSKIGMFLILLLTIWFLYDVFLASNSWLYPEDEGDNNDA